MTAGIGCGSSAYGKKDRLSRFDFQFMGVYIINRETRPKFTQDKEKIFAHNIWETDA